jgi:outer membrane biogenesis lipoprotein LolB
MIRRNLLIVTAVVVSFVLTACSDMTGPKSEACPVVNGSQTCLQ